MNVKRLEIHIEIDIEWNNPKTNKKKKERNNNNVSHSMWYVFLWSLFIYFICMKFYGQKLKI